MKTIKKQLKYFTCGKNELERINDALQNRNIDADSVISITDNGDWVTIWYRCLIFNFMELKIENEKTEKIFSKTLDGLSVEDFYCIEDDILNEFLQEMETKYNATMDFTGGEDFIKYTIYEIEDDSVFEKILDEWFNFILNNV